MNIWNIIWGTVATANCIVLLYALCQLVADYAYQRGWRDCDALRRKLQSQLGDNAEGAKG